MRNNQKGRRNLPEAWIIELELGNKEDLAEIGRAKKSANGGDRGNQHTGGKSAAVVKNDNSATDSNPDQKPAKHNTREKIAESAGVSTGQVAQAEIVRREAPSPERIATGDGGS